jgi:ElaB/YqjD/DUF883 family membrane-anchored ribosome-binding protein
MMDVKDLSEQKPEEIRSQIDETRSNLTEKLEALEERVTGTVQSAKETVAETIENVKETVQDTVQTVKHTFDIQLQVERHPWTMVCGSVVAGFVAGTLWQNLRPGSPSERYRESEQKLYHREPPAFPNLAQDRAYARPNGFAPSQSGPSPSGGLLDGFQDEVRQIKATAIGFFMGWLRDLVKEAVPAVVAPQLGRVIDSATVKLGGTPVVTVVPERQFHPGYESTSDT